jgi:acetoin utilization deacetylase AcuC-like enzyme
VPLAPGTGDEGWLAGVERLAAFARERGAGALVVALGVDAAAGDPESPLRVTADGFRRAGRALGRLRLPTVLVQEGGYDLATLGGLVLAVLEGFEEGRDETA